MKATRAVFLQKAIYACCQLLRICHGGCHV
jgi:hypothetical protein